MKVVEYDRLARNRAAEYPLDWTVSRMCPSCQSGTPQASSYEPKAVWVRPRPCEGHSTKPWIRACHAYPPSRSMRDPSGAVYLYFYKQVFTVSPQCQRVVLDTPHNHATTSCPMESECQPPERGLAPGVGRGGGEDRK